MGYREAMAERDDAAGLIPLEDAEAPSVPNKEIARRYLGRLIALFQRKRSEPLIAMIFGALVRFRDQIFSQPFWSKARSPLTEARLA